MKMSKTRILTAILALAIIFSVFLPLPVSAAGAQNTKIIEATFGKTKFSLNGELLKVDSLVYNGTAYLPAAYFARKVGLSARWDSESNITYLTYSYRAPEEIQENNDTLKEPVTKRIQVTFGSPVYYLNGVPLEKESLTYNGAAYLPASFLAKAIGLNPIWDAATNITNINFRPVTKISFPEGKIVVERYSDTQLNPVISPENASFKILRYSSSNENIVTVSQDGEIYAKNEGEATVTCLSVNGVSEKITIKVIIPVTNIYVYPERYRYQTGETAEFRVEVYPLDATDKSYSLSVDGEILNGDLFECLKSGKVTITATASNNISNSANIMIVDLKEYAAEVAELVNVERRKNGLKELIADYGILNDCAFLRANELIELYSHTRPNGTDCFTAYKGMSFYIAGENIAMCQTTPAEVMKDWMNSPGHRGNILESRFTAIGVGVAMDKNGTLYWSQNFIGN